MKTTRSALFVNFSNEAFTGYWDGVAYPFAPAAQMYLEEWKARHFAKHLANRELLKDGYETHTSPKKPEDDKIFMRYFSKAFKLNEDVAPLPESSIADVLLNQNRAIDFNDEIKPIINNVSKPQASRGRGRPVVAKDTTLKLDDETFEGLQNGTTTSNA